jgi:HAMP domain-containing protein
LLLLLLLLLLSLLLLVLGLTVAGWRRIAANITKLPELTDRNENGSPKHFRSGLF